MRPPLAGRRATARRLAEEVRRRLEPVERVLPVKLPGFGAGAGTAAGGATGAKPQATSPPPSPSPSPEEAVARIDAARERLRAAVEPPPQDSGG